MRKPHRFLFLLGTKISAKSPSEVFEPELNVSGWKWITPRTLGTFLASIVGAGSANKETEKIKGLQLGDVLSSLWICSF